MRYATTVEEQNELGDCICSAIEQCIKELGFVTPLVPVCVSTNGSVFALRTDGKNVELLAVHIESPGFALPLNIIVTDAHGEATRLLITNDGMRRLN